MKASHKKITLPFLLSALLISLTSYTRYMVVGAVDLERVYPNEAWSLYLFIMYLVAILLSLYGYYNVIFKEEYNFRSTLRLSYAVYVISSISLPLLSSDIFLYIVAGDVKANYNLNPYTDYRFFDISEYSKYISVTWSKTYFFRYGILNAYIMEAVGKLGGPSSIWLNIFVYKLFVLLFGILYIHIGHYIIRTYKGTCTKPITSYTKGTFGDFTKREREKVLAFILLSPVLWIQGIGQGHNDIFVLVFCFPGLYFMLKGQYIGAALSFTLALNVKLYGLLMLLMLIYYIVMRYKFSYKTIYILAKVLIATFLLSVVLHLRFWEGFATLLLPYRDMFVGAAGPMNSVSFILGFVVEKLIPQWSLYLSYSLFYYIVLSLGLLLGCYLLYRMYKAAGVGEGGDFVYLAGHGFVLLFSFGIGRFHPWYFLVSLGFFGFRNIGRSWLLWGVYFFPLVNLVDIYNFMGHDTLALVLSLPIILLGVNILLFLWLSGRYIKRFV